MNEHGKRSVSIRDVALLAKTSVTTVSRYLNHTGPVGAATSQRIESAIAVLDYRPNPFARALVTDRTNVITVFTSSITLYGQTHTLEGIEERCAANGFSLNTVILDATSPETVRGAVKASLAHNPAGVILLFFDPTAGQALAHIPEGIPLVCVSGDTGNRAVARLLPDEYDGGYRLARHLIELGHQSLCYVGFPEMANGMPRLTACQDACREAGVPAPTFIQTSWELDDARSAGRRIGEEGRFSAALAGNDELAMGVIRGLEDAGKVVPDDISVTGFDDHAFAKIWSPALTTVRQDFTAVGRDAFELLAPQIEEVSSNKPPSEVWKRIRIFPCDLIVRESTTRPPVR